MSTLQKRKYIKKRGKKVAHHGTTKEKVIEYQTEKARVYQPGHLGATDIIYRKVPTQHEYVIKDESWEYTCICCGEKTIIREKISLKDINRSKNGNCV